MKKNKFDIGGSMDILSYDLFRDKQNIERQKAELKNKVIPSSLAGLPKGLFSFGGNMGTNSSDFTSGLTHIDAGGSHSENPNDGVQVGVDPEGTPNLVEEGETIWNDYVFSARINADAETKKKFHLPLKKDITYAEISKKLEKEIAERVNDPISEAGFKAQMQTLQEQQERQKQEMEAERAKAAFEALSSEEQTAIMQRAAQEEQMAQQATQEQAAAEQQPQATPEELAMAEQAQQQADGTQAMVGQESQINAEGGHLFGTGGDKKNAGTWKKGTSAENWNKYTRKGLKDFLQSVNDKLAKAKSDEEKNQIREDAIKTVRGIQQAYSEAYQNNLTPSEMNEKVTILQKAFEKAGGNAYFDNIAENINLPKGHNTNDTKEKGWVDGLWGPRTSIRNWGSTEYGEDYDDIKALAQQAGMTYAPGQFKYDNNTLYELGMARPEVIADPKVGNGLVEGIDYMTEPQEETSIIDVNENAGEDDFVEVDENGNSKKKVAPNLKNEKLRYAGLFGPAVGLGMQALGIGKPDYSGLDAAVNAANGPIERANYQPIGNYLTYNPMDIWYQQNALNAQARATDRALANSTSPSRAAGLLASGYNSQLASGNLYRQALEYNDAQRKQVEDFNRGTNMFNADAYNKLSMFNAGEQNRARQYGAQMAMHAANTKLDSDAGWYNGIYGNVAGLFKGIGDLGKENAQHNMIAKMWADGLAGSATPDTNTASDYLEWARDNKKKVKAAKGGTIKRKKGKRRGLTI